MSKQSYVAHPLCRPPIWLFDLESKSVYFGLQHPSTKNNLYPASTPTIFALPCSASPNWYNPHTSRKRHTSKSKQNSSQIPVEPRLQLTTQTQSPVLAGPARLTAYTSRYESVGQLAMGHRTKRGMKAMVRKLSDWEARWRKLGGT